MKYLSQLSIEKERALRLRLYDGYRWHQKIWEVYSDHPDQSRDFLFRVDDYRYRFNVLILSAKKPNIPDWGAWKITEILPSFFSFSTYRFSLRANPTTKRVVRNEKGERKKNGRRTGLYDYFDLEKWFKRKAETGGFHISELSISPPMRNRFRKKSGGGVHIYSDFEGILTVFDQSCFINTFKKGIGPSKAFGFGLLQIKPLG